MGRTVNMCEYSMGLLAPLPRSLLSCPVLSSQARGVACEALLLPQEGCSVPSLSLWLHTTLLTLSDCQPLSLRLSERYISTSDGRMGEFSGGGMSSRERDEH